MCQFWPKIPSPEVLVGTRLGHKDDDGHGGQRDRNKEDRLVSEHDRVHSEDHQGCEEAEEVEESSAGQQALFVAGLESPHPERR